MDFVINLSAFSKAMLTNIEVNKSKREVLEKLLIEENSRFSEARNSSEKQKPQANLFSNEKVLHANTEKSRFLDYGIERDVFVHELGITRTYNVANNARTALELFEKNMQIDKILSFKDFFSEEEKEDFFEQILLLKDLEHYNNIVKIVLNYCNIDWLKFYAKKDEDNSVLPLWKQEFTKILANYMYEHWRHTFALTGAFALCEYYNFPLKVEKINVFAKKDELFYAVSKFCNEYSFTLKSSTIENNAKYGLFDVDFSLEGAELIFNEIYPTKESNSLANMIFCSHRAVRKISDEDIPFLCFDDQFELLKTLFENSVDRLEALHHICLLGTKEHHYYGEISGYLQEKGIKFYADIILKESSDYADSKALVVSFIAICKKILEEQEIIKEHCEFIMKSEEEPIKIKDNYLNTLKKIREIKRVLSCLNKKFPE